METSILKYVAGAAIWLALSSAMQAASIVGGISFGGSLTLDTGNINNATAFSSFSGVYVSDVSGTFATAGIPFWPDSVSMFPFTFNPFPAGGVGGLWFTSTTTPSGFAFFDLTNLTQRLQPGPYNTLTLRGQGTLYMSGFTDAPGSFDFTVYQSGSTFTFSMNCSAIDPTNFPSISSEPVDQLAARGASASFSVTASGAPPLSYQWQFNGNPRAGATAATLALTNVQTTNAGNYWVVVTNDYGSVTSTNATLTIDPSINSQPTSLTVSPGQDALFSVAAAGTAPLSFQWWKNGGILPGATTSSLTVTNAQRADAGTTCQVVVSNQFGSVTSAVAVLTVNLSTTDSLNPGANLAVYCMAWQADGKILMGGEFTRLAGQTRNSIGRLNADGTLDNTFDPGATNSLIYCLAVQEDGRILVGGAFSMLGGQSRTNIARLNADGTLDTAFNPGAGGSYPYVNSVALQADGRILLGGEFTTLGGYARNGIGRLNADGTLDTAFNPGAGGSYPYVNSVALQADGRILLGGEFTTLGGYARNGIGRLNTDGTLDTTFNPGTDGSVNCLAVQGDGKIVVGGYFSTLAGQTRYNFGRLFPNGTLDPVSDTAGASGAVVSFALQADGKYLSGGDFHQLRNRIARSNADNNADQTFNPGADSFVLSLALQPDGNILVGGRFTMLGGQPRNNFGRLNNTDPATQTLAYDGSTIAWLRGGTSPEVWRTSFDASTNGTDWASLGAGTRILGGWQLTGVSVPTNATIRARGFTTGGSDNGSSWFVETLAALTAPPVVTSQPLDRTNNAHTTATFSVGVLSMLPTYQWLRGGQILNDGGNISGVHTPRLSLADVLGGDTSGYSVVISNAYGSVTSAVAILKVVDPVILTQPVSQSPDRGQGATLSVTAAGTAPLTYQWWKDGVALAQGTGANLVLTNLQGTDAGSYWAVVSNVYDNVTSMVAILTVNGATLDPSFNPGAVGGSYPYVYSLALQADGKILVGGEFTTLGGQTRNHIGRLNADGSLDTSFNPGANSSSSVYSLAVQADGRILVGGYFTTLGGQSRNSLGRLNADGSLDTNFNTVASSSSYVFCLAVQADGKTLVGGRFTTLGGLARTNISRLNADGSLDTSFNPGVGGASTPDILSLAVQADGKVLVGGEFTTLGGQTRNYIGRLNADGNLDTSFNPGANSWVYSLAVQADGKTLVGGEFTMLGGQTRNYIGRLNTDGSLDTSFNPGAGGGSYPYVYSLGLQADGKILVGGEFTTLGGQTRNHIGRLNADGSLDTSFFPVADNIVMSLAVQADGKTLVGGEFTTLGGGSRNYLGRLNNTEPATQSLSYDGLAVTWLRGGTSPEVWRTTFDVQTNGTDWNSLGVGTRIPGGWQLVGVNAPTSATVRARAVAAGGLHNASSWFVESTMTVAPKVSPTIMLNDGNFGFRSNQFGFTLSGIIGQVVAMETSTNLSLWVPLQTNTLGSPTLYFSDPDSAGQSQRFYRARLVQ